jgi:L-asparaginase/Glu-tRNA(Gln) amidotransferase subunit D
VFQPRAAEVTADSPVVHVQRSFDDRLSLALRRRRLQRLQQGLVTAGWVGGSAALLLLAAAGLLGLH